MTTEDNQTTENDHIPEWLDDALCDVLAASHNGDYDGLTVTERLERLIERVRTPPIDGRSLITAERLRQVDEEEYDSAHDEMHGPEPLGLAAECYRRGSQTYGWPWSGGFKPKDPLSNLIRAGALYLAAAEVADPKYVSGSVFKIKRMLLQRAEECADEIDALLDKAREVVTPPGQEPTDA